MQLHEVLPNDEALLELAPEELAQIVLKILVEEGERSSLHSSYNFTLGHNLKGYSDTDSVARAVMEAWSWLVREGLVADRPGDSNGSWIFVTRRGYEASKAIDWSAYHRANTLPKKFLNSRIAIKVWSTFLRGDYDTAVFQAYKELEIIVREKIKEGPTCLGTHLMRKAFHKENGILTDKDTPIAEREALASMFVGAIGSYKNPHSHRHVPIDSYEASEMIILASHLMNIVEKRAEKIPD